MDQLGLCQPATAIVLVGLAGVIYHLVAGPWSATLWWLIVGGVGGAVFQTLCYGGLEPVAWILMLIPVLVVCFFLAVALFAARMRIQNVREVPCDRCGRPRGPHGCGCGGSGQMPSRKPRCNRPACGGCPTCLWGGGGPGIDDGYAEGGAIERFTDSCPCQSCGCIGGPCPDCGRPGQRGCNQCGGSGCPYCAYAATVAADGDPKMSCTM